MGSPPFNTADTWVCFALTAHSQLTLGLPLTKGEQTVERLNDRPAFLVTAKAIARGPQLAVARPSRVATPVTEIADRLLIALGIGGTVAILLSGGIGWWLTRRSVQPIEQSVQQLRQFTADASHELRNPLTAIQTTVRVMANHPERIHPADAAKFEAIASATQQMAQVVNDLLLLAQTDARKFYLSTTDMPVPIHDLLEDLLESIESQASAKEITLRAQLEQDVWVKGDPNHFRQIFTNLLDNALQYTPVGGRIEVFLSYRDSTAIARIQDTGIGIAPEHLSHVSDRFWRTDQARSYRKSGSGLGLTIAQANPCKV